MTGGHGDRRARSSKALTRAGLALAAYVTFASTFAPSAAGQSSEPFAAFAQADGLIAAASNPSLPLGIVIQGVGPDATVHRDSLGTADSTASFPYLGEGVQGLPGLLAGAFNVPLPTYPLQATVSAGQAPAHTTAPGVDLTAEVTSEGPRAEATAGTQAIGATTTATITMSDDGRITSRAQSIVNVVDLAGLLTLRGVESRAEVVADPSSGEIERSSTLSIGALSAPGLSITVPETTPGEIPIPVPIPGLPQIPPVTLPTIPLPFAGQRIEAPRIGFENGSFTLAIPGIGNRMFPIPAQPVLAAFKAVGIDITIEQPQELTTGIQAPVLSFHMGVELPDNPSLQGVTSLDVSLGRTIATVDLHPAGIPDLSDVPEGLAPDVGPLLGDAGSPAFVPPAVGSPTGPAAPPNQPGTNVGVATAPIGLQHEAGVFYSVLVMVAASMVAAGQYLRLKGVRTAWDS